MAGNHKVDAIEEAARFALMFEDPIAKIFEMFPDEDNDAGTSEITTGVAAAKSIEDSGLVDDGSESSYTANQAEGSPVNASQPHGTVPSEAEDTVSTPTFQPNPKDNDLRYWCGEAGCGSSRKVYTGLRAHRYMSQHYYTHHFDLWFDKERLVAHKNGPEGEKCMQMRARTEDDKPRPRRPPRKVKKEARMTVSDESEQEMGLQKPEDKA